MSRDFRLNKPTQDDLTRMQHLWEQHPRYRGCVVHLLGNDGYGEQVRDISSLTGFHHGVYVGGAEWVGSKYGPVLDQQGTSSQYIGLSNLSTYFANEEGTLSIWVKLTDHTPSVDNETGAWSVDIAGGLNHYPWKTGDIYDGTFSTTRWLVGTGVITDRTVWHHVCITRNSTNWIFYQNGRVADSRSSAAWSMTTDFRIGMSTNTVVLNGQYTDIRLYNRALSPQEVASLYREPMLEFAWASDRLSYSRNIALPGSGGGITAALTDTIALTESSTLTADYTASLSDTVALTESSTTTATFPVASSDTVALTESGATAASGVGALTDTVSVSESSGAVLDLLASASDSASLTESTDAVAALLAAASDSISLTESSLTDSALSATSTDSIALTDACVGEASYNPVSTDTIALTGSSEEVSAALGSSRRTGVNEQVSVLGTDYATIALWESGEDNDLVTAAASEVLECPAGTYAGEVTLSGATTNASYFRIIRPVAGAEHHGDPTAGVFIEMTATFAIRLNENYACLHDVNCTVNIDSATTKQVVYPTADNIAITNCMVIDPVNTSGGATHSFGSTGSCDDTSFINCLAVGAISAGFRLSGTGSNMVAYNCTSVDAGDDGFFNGDTTFRFINCLSTGSNALDFDFTTAPAVSDYLASGDATADDNGGTGNRISQTFTFIDALNDDYHLSSSDAGAKGFGTDLSSDPNFAFNDDIDGNVVTTWSIGFDSDPIVSASLTDTISVTESSTGLSVLSGSASDTVALTESNTGLATFTADQSESLVLAESSVSTLVFLATRSDSVALTESALGMLVVLASLADTVALTESSLATSNLSASASDTVSLTDSSSVVSAFNAGLSDTLTLTESSLSALVLLASRSDSVVLTDSSLGVLVILASASDTVALSESGLSTGVFTGLSSDTLALVESSIGNSVSDASFSDTINLTELGSVPTDFPVSLSDVLTITETSNGVLTRLVSLIDVIPEDFALYAEQSGLGTVNTNLFRGGLLAKPDAQVCFALSTGPAPERVLDGRNVVDMPTLRVLVRGAPGDRKGAATTATRVYEMFDGLTGKTIGSNKYQTVFATSPPAPFAIDESGRRPVYSVDFELRIARV